QRELKVTTSPSALAADKTVTNPDNTVLMTVTARASNGQAAVNLANAWADQLAYKIAAT
ncbi:MAG: hypothetical protein QOH37_1589, partial [Nocardioidaceae bacterium]|nr:hypothetical protein [Nocardioidaceae bacterium]